MNIRLADHSDIPVLVELRKKQLVDEGLTLDSDVDIQFADYFTAAITDGSFISWVMEDNGEIIATSGVCFYSLPPTFANPTGRIAYVTNIIYTKPEYRRKGIATGLLGMVIHEVKSRSYVSIRLHASKMGKSIYEKAGFIDTDGYMALK
jgi:GNAT superfamily N-acetyltransferase